MKIKLKKYIITAILLSLGLSGAHADTYLVGREQGAQNVWKAYLELNFTAASLGTIHTGVYGSGPDAGMGAGDLIIFYREGDSGQYDDGTEVADWNNNGAKILILNPWVTRSSRFGWFDNTTIIEDFSTTGSETTASVPGDSLFNGVTLTGGLADLYTDPVASGDSNLDTQDGFTTNGTVLATSGGGVILARIASGAAWSSAAQGGQSGTHGGDRIYFPMAEDLDQAGFETLTADGKTILDNVLVELGLVADSSAKAVDDTYDLPYGVVDLTANVLDNDKFATSAFVVTNLSGGGSLSFTNSTGSFAYTAAGEGTETFWYSAVNATSTSTPAKVTLIVTLTDTVTAGEDAYRINYNLSDATNLTVDAAGGVLYNDSSLQVLPLSASLVDDSGLTGTLDSFNSDGSFSYTASPGFEGVDTFTYQAQTVGDTSSPTTVSISVGTTLPVLISHWKLDETAVTNGATLADSTGNGNDATIVNTFSNITGVIDGAVSLPAPDDGTASTATAGSFTNLSEFTVSVWYNPKETVTQTGGGGRFQTLVSNSPGNNNFRLYVYADDTDQQIRFWIRRSDGFWDSTNVSLDSILTDTTGVSAPLGDDIWFHIVASYDGAGNTSLTVTEAAGGSGFSGSAARNISPLSYLMVDEPMGIGTRSDSNGNRLNGGYLDDIQIYNAAMNADQVQYLYDNPGSTFVPGIPTENPIISTTVAGGSLILSWTDGFSYNVLTNADLTLSNWGVYTNSAAPVIIPVGSETELFYKTEYP